MLSQVAIPIQNGIGDGGLYTIFAGLLALSCLWSGLIACECLVHRAAVVGADLWVK